MSKPSILLILSNANNAHILTRAALLPAGYEVSFVSKWKEAELALKNAPPDLVILGDSLEEHDTQELAWQLFENHPLMPVILYPTEHSEERLARALRMGFSDYLRPPLNLEEARKAVSGALDRRRSWKQAVQLETRLHTQSLEKRMDGLEALRHIGSKITSVLELDNVLKAVVDSAVELTGAEEGSLLLLEEVSGDLYMRAGRNYQEDFVSTFRLAVQDSLAGQVVSSGKPIILDASSPKKIKTSYLVHTLIYVPMVLKEHTIGVLGVANRKTKKPFKEQDIPLLSILADYAAIAIENARLFENSEIERRRMEAILTKMEEGVIIIDQEHRVILINPLARHTFQVGEGDLTGKPLEEVIQHTELLEATQERSAIPCQMEVKLEDGLVLNTQISPIPEIGLVITMQDITSLKELDRVKNEFVHTVSHDLRSPLTAILGYVELLERVGPINTQQRDFIRRVQVSVQNITALINDLLDLGRIEAGFDARKEAVSVNPILQFTVDDILSQAIEKKQAIDLDAPTDLPEVVCNPVRLRQMISNLLSNAIKFSPDGSLIRVRASCQSGQLILQVSDNGPGIPPADQPYIFDRFFRGSNMPPDTPGTGLGLTIVKSIVENHQGRIWVDSTLGQGSTFTVVLPVSDNPLPHH